MAEAVLSKSRYLAGLQCPLRLWLAVHRPELAAPPDDATRQRMDDGARIGRAAHGLYPPARAEEVGLPGGDFAAAASRTRALLADERRSVLFEAAFEHAGVRVRVDVLERDGRGGFVLGEVKSSTRVKPEHLPDVALQRWVAEGAGLRVSRAELHHVDADYTRGEGEIEWSGFFTSEDVTHRIEEELQRTPEQVRLLGETARSATPPSVEPSAHCRRPHPCPFWQHCTSGKPAVWHLRQKRVREDVLARWEQAARTGVPWISPALAERLQAIEPPVVYLDFEALSGAIPLYGGTRPYAHIPFQWSIHRLERDGSLLHREFLADGRDDPRRSTAESLLAALAGDDLPIVVYSPYEHQRIQDLAAALPDLAEPLAAVDARLFDLLPLLRSSFYHPAFGGSFSIKKVAPALAPQLTYADLPGVADGTAAASAFERIATGEVAGAAARSLRAELLAYCERDTLAMVEVHRALRRRVG